MTNKKGYIYVLTNEYIPDLVKIGYTTRDPEKRAWELYEKHTGVPDKFEVAYQKKVSNCKAAEQRIHEFFNKYRTNEYREFFKVSTKIAKPIVEAICEEVNLKYNEKTPNPISHVSSERTATQDEKMRKIRQNKLAQRWESAPATKNDKSILYHENGIPLAQYASSQSTMAIQKRRAAIIENSINVKPSKFKIKSTPPAPIQNTPPIQAKKPKPEKTTDQTKKKVQGKFNTESKTKASDGMETKLAAGIKLILLFSGFFYWLFFGQRSCIKTRGIK